MILVTGAAGRLGSVGFKTVQLLRQQELPVRAMVRTLDERAQALTDLGAEVVQGDLTSLDDMHRVLAGVRRLYFGMSVAANYLEATLNVAAVAKYLGVELLINISQMTVSQMSIHDTTPSPQQKMHWLGEQALNWSGLPVVHVRATVFLEHFFFQQWAQADIAEHGELRLPFGSARTSPIATEDVARVVATLLSASEVDPGRVYELTGPRAQNLQELADSYSRALGRPVRGVEVSPEQLSECLQGMPEHVRHHLLTMASLHREGRYDRQTEDVETITGQPALSVEQWLRRGLSTGG